MSVKVQPKLPQLETRTTGLFDGVLEVKLGSPELREEGAFPKIRGYAAVFNQLSQPLMWGMRERIKPGAFKQTLADGADVRALFNHDPSQILGRSKAGTLRLEEDSIGLRYVIDPPNTTLGRDVIESIRRGDVTQSSFGFRSKDEEYKKENGEFVRELVAVDLFDVSPVTYPAYLGTSVNVRSLYPQAESAEAQNALEMFYRDIRRTVDPPHYVSPEHERKLRLRRLELIGQEVAAGEEQVRASMKMQAVIFDKGSWSSERAKKWLSDHGFKNDKFDETRTSYKFEQLSPSEHGGGFETLTSNMPRGVKMLACKG